MHKGTGRPLEANHGLRRTTRRDIQLVNRAGGGAAGDTLLSLYGPDRPDALVEVADDIGAGTFSRITLALAGWPGDPATAGVRITTTVTLLEDGTARIEAFAAQAFGQELEW